MFEKKKSLELPKLYASTDACSYALKRLKYLNDGSLLVLENNFDDFTVQHININGEVLNKWSVAEKDGLLVDYMYIKDTMYMYFINTVSDYEENIVIYRSSGTEIKKITTLRRESYQHDMDYFRLFQHNEECRLLLVRHNRMHLYIIGDVLHEIMVLEGGKWFISGDYVANSMGRDWELYDSSLELINMFRFEEDVEWVDIDASADSQVIAMATDNASNEIGGLYVFDKQQGSYKIHYQRYGFYHIAVCYGKVWTSVSSMYSDIGGLMIFDKTASLKFAHLRDIKDDVGAQKAYLPAPLMAQALYIAEMADGTVMLADNDKITIVDTTCRMLQEIKQPGYDCFAISNDKKSLAFLNLGDKLHGNDAEKKYDASIDFYEWDSEWKKSFVVDITSFRK